MSILHGVYIQIAWGRANCWAMLTISIAVYGCLCSIETPASYFDRHRWQVLLHYLALMSCFRCRMLRLQTGRGTTFEFKDNFRCTFPSGSSRCEKVGENFFTFPLILATKWGRFLSSLIFIMGSFCNYGESLTVFTSSISAARRLSWTWIGLTLSLDSLLHKLGSILLSRFILLCSSFSILYGLRIGLILHYVCFRHLLIVPLEKQQVWSIHYGFRTTNVWEWIQSEFELVQERIWLLCEQSFHLWTRRQTHLLSSLCSISVGERPESALFPLRNDIGRLIAGNICSMPIVGESEILEWMLFRPGKDISANSWQAENILQILVFDSKLGSPMRGSV